MYRIGKTFTFDAGHHLLGLPEGHKCSRPHGHGYSVEVVLVGDRLRGPGFLSDFADLNSFGEYIKERLDHRDLNEVLDVPTTCERIAQHLADWIIEHVEEHLGGHLESVKVTELGGSWASYTPDRGAV